MEQHYRREQWIQNSFKYTSVELDRVDLLRAGQSNEAGGDLSRCTALSRGIVRALPVPTSLGMPGTNLTQTNGRRANQPRDRPRKLVSRQARPADISGELKVKSWIIRRRGLARDQKNPFQTRSKQIGVESTGGHFVVFLHIQLMDDLSGCID